MLHPLAVLDGAEYIFVYQIIYVILKKQWQYALYWAKYIPHLPPEGFCASQELARIINCTCTIKYISLKSNSRLSWALHVSNKTCAIKKFSFVLSTNEIN